MKKEIADLVDLQELFEMAGPSIFLDDFDVSGFIASIKNEDGVLVPPRFEMCLRQRHGLLSNLI